MKRFSDYIFLLVSFLIYSLTGVFTKFASMQEFLSWQYILLLGGAIFVIGIYAILWQQIIRRMPVSDAFMWKGTTIVWTMLLAYSIFGEPITIHNIIGSVIIIAGITLYAWSDKKEAAT
ncbi:MAG: EamA family transporter [Bacteroidaceae bacterium]|nr:EamA family transporter [Bacteroidaceae bacterium]